MPLPPTRRGRRAAHVATAVLAAGVVVATATQSAGAANAAGAAAADTVPNVSALNLLGVPIGFTDIDARTGRVAPTTSQLGAVTSLGGVARWNRFGTPESLIKYGSVLGSGYGGSPKVVARAWLADHAALFRMTSTDVGKLEMFSDQVLASGSGHAVLFRQHYGSLPAAQDGLIDVAVKGDKVYYVSSSASGPQTAPPAATLSPLAAWVKAAANVSRPIALTALSTPIVRDGWTLFTAPGFGQVQRARLVAVPTPGGTARPAFETIVLDSSAGRSPTAYTIFVDAVTGNVLMRYNRVDESQSNNQFSATFTPTACGPAVPGGSVDAATKQIVVVGSADVATNDIKLQLIFNNAVVASSDDTGIGQEDIVYAPSGGVPAGDYFVAACPSGAPAGPFLAPYTASGLFVSSDTATPGAPASALPYPPKWKYFYSSPPLTYSSTDTRKTGCWVTTGQTGCDRKEQNLASRSPWDVNVNTGLPSFTTIGNNAITGEAWLSPLSPGGVQRPVAADRNYSFTWQNQWNSSKCDPTSLVSTNRNDIDPAVTNLFAGHNRFHDFAYYLGFTEDNYNAQASNFGNGGAQNDPELGDVQAGAVDGGAPSYEGRDNANQIALNDGVPPITNQYLFQPISGSFYAACTDGDYDTSVFGHEYTHLISNRMVGGPDDNLTGLQAGSMGESWSDLDALEYLHEFGYVPQDGANDWAEGPYVTGDKQRGIRNYGLNTNPLNYSDVGYDITGAEVHADGEIWNAVNYDIRQALVAKYNASFPATSTSLQLACAQGQRTADQCPGNRRWIQLVYDGFLLQPAEDSMLDARDSYLAADMMRFGGANQSALWVAFAKRGFGKAASTTSADDPDPVPSFVAKTGSKAGTVKFTAVALEQSGRPAVSGAKIYIGNYSAGVTPVAVTAANGTATFSAEPGTYHVIVQKPGYGVGGYPLTVTAGTTTSMRLDLFTNLASATNGATATGDGNPAALVDDSEATSWTADSTARVDVTKPSVTIDLAGTAPVMVRSLRVSAFTQDGGGRFTALRQFAVAACTASVTNPGCANPAGFTTVYTSPADAFPARQPRPLAPDLNARTFDIPDTAATHLKLIVLNNQCTGTPAYQGDQDNDPLNNSDCVAGDNATSPLLTPQAPTVKAAEFEAFDYDVSSRVPGDPLVVVSAIAPASVARSSSLSYTLGYTNLGPQPSAHAKLVDVLPAGVTFVSADGGGVYNATTRTVTWSLGTVAVTFTGTRHLVVKATGLTGTQVINQPTFTGDLTQAVPGFAFTTIV